MPNETNRIMAIEVFKKMVREWNREMPSINYSQRLAFQIRNEVLFKKAHEQVSIGWGHGGAPSNHTKGHAF